MYGYVCEVCGCSLDPGEGHICDDCRKEMSYEARRRKEVEHMVQSTNYEQIEMEEFLK